MTKPEEWTFVSGWVSARAERLLDRRAIVGLLDSEDPEEIAARLRSSLLFAEAPPGPAPIDEVDRRFGAKVEEVASASPDVRIGDLFLMDRRWHRFRQFAKSALIGEPESAARRPAKPSAERELFRECWEGRAEGERLRPFVEASDALRAASREAADIAGMVDRVCDAHEAAALVATARALGGEMLSDWVTDWVRLRAALAFFRARQIGWDTASIIEPWRGVGLDSPDLMSVALCKHDELPAVWERLGISGAREILAAPTGSAAREAPVAMARRIEAHLTRRISEAQGIPYGPEKVFEFLWRLRREAAAIKAILAAAASGIAKEKTAEELLA